eukprot:m.211310 g.211310  ORF g.211310 m.211310 type:complete len:446 (-) comp26140_c0_seq8:2195-3532(-)
MHIHTLPPTPLHPFASCLYLPCPPNSTTSKPSTTSPNKDDDWGDDDEWNDDLVDQVAQTQDQLQHQLDEEEEEDGPESDGVLPPKELPPPQQNEDHFRSLKEEMTKLKGENEVLRQALKQEQSKKAALAQKQSAPESAEVKRLQAEIKNLQDSVSFKEQDLVNMQERIDQLQKTVAKASSTGQAQGKILPEFVRENDFQRAESVVPAATPAYKRKRLVEPPPMTPKQKAASALEAKKQSNTSLSHGKNIASCPSLSMSKDPSPTPSKFGDRSPIQSDSGSHTSGYRAKRRCTLDPVIVPHISQDLGSNIFQLMALLRGAGGSDHLCHQLATSMSCLTSASTMLTSSVSHGKLLLPVLHDCLSFALDCYGSHLGILSSTLLLIRKLVQDDPHIRPLMFPAVISPHRYRYLIVFFFVSFISCLPSLSPPSPSRLVQHTTAQSSPSSW